MNVLLRPDLENLVNEKIKSGHYRSAEEVLNAALQLLKEHDEAEDRLESLLQEGEDSGPGMEMTAKDWAAIEKEGLKRFKSRKSA